MHENNYVDEICADLLSDLPIVDHDRGEIDLFFLFNTFISYYVYKLSSPELDENRNDISNSNTRRRSRRTVRTRLLSENVTSVITESERDHNSEIHRTLTPENRSPQTRVTESLERHLNGK